MSAKCRRRLRPGHGAPRGLVTLIGVGLVVSLAGCIPLDRMSVRYIAGELEFATCHTVTANTIEAAVRPAEDGDEVETVWLLEGDIRVRPGDTFLLGQDVGGMTTVKDEVLMPDANHLFFTIGFRDENGEYDDVRTARFTVSDIREGEWTRSNGSRGEEPCE